MRAKAREFFHEARTLAAAGKANGAASRLYYALYHALVAVFEEQGIKQASLTHKVDPQNPGYWLHEVVRNNATLAGVERRDSNTVRQCWRLRILADYSNEFVTLTAVETAIPAVRKIFIDLGIEV